MKLKSTWTAAVVVLTVLTCPAWAHATTYSGSVTDPVDRPAGKPDLKSFEASYDDTAGVVKATFTLQQDAPRVQFRFGLSRKDHGGCAVPPEQPDLNVTGLVVTSDEGGAIAQATLNSRTGLYFPLDEPVVSGGSPSFTVTLDDGEPLSRVAFRCVSDVYVDDDDKGAGSSVEAGDGAAGFCLTGECQQQPVPATPTPVPTASPAPQPTATPTATPGPQQGVLDDVQSGQSGPAAKVLGSATLKRFARSGLRIRVTCARRCKPSLKLKVSKATARKLGSSTTLVTRARRRGRAKRSTLTVKPAARLVSRLLELKRLEAKLVVSVPGKHGTVRQLSRPLTLKR